jgi:hypothetical protein
MRIVISYGGDVSPCVRVEERPMSGSVNRIACAGAVAAALGLLACQSLDSGAKSAFSRSFTCPMDRVEVRPRPELHPSNWFKPRTPTSEVASDPGRLKMWQDQQEKLRTSSDSYHWIYEARGCGHQALYECGRTSRGSSSGVMCRAQQYLPGMSQW